MFFDFGPLNAAGEGLVLGIFAGVSLLFIRGIRSQLALAKQIMEEGIDAKATILRKFNKTKRAAKGKTRNANMVSYSFYAVKDGKQVLVTMPEKELMDGATWEGLTENSEADVKYLSRDPSLHELVPILRSMLEGQAQWLPYIIGIIFAVGGFGFAFVHASAIGMELLGFVESDTPTSWYALVLYIGAWLIPTISIPIVCFDRLMDTMRDDVVTTEADPADAEAATEPLIVQGKVVENPDPVEATVIENQAPGTVVEGKAIVVAVEDIDTNEPVKDKATLMCCTRG
eukprot:TRINITY_DN26407_c0_g1_i1.p1 TRINITY_DN26407_c0_g1~~TRINITY_DN26407_c0_g1_i1.p1  ORF type:complete len:306 (-),score=41.92 TRINITY_DN26407_c0_g1_i1:95-952(-)